MALAAELQDSTKDNNDYFSFSPESLNDKVITTPSLNNKPRHNNTMYTHSVSSINTPSIDEHSIALSTINNNNNRRMSLQKSQVSFGVYSAETDPTPFSEPEIIVPPGPHRHSTSLTVSNNNKKKTQQQQQQQPYNSNRLSRNHTTGHMEATTTGEELTLLSSRQKAFRRLSRRKLPPDTTDDDDRVIMGTRISEGHRNYILMYNMLTGIRIAVGRVSAKPDRPLVQDDFTAAHKLAFDV